MKSELKVEAFKFDGSAMMWADLDSQSKMTQVVIFPFHGAHESQNA